MDLDPLDFITSIELLTRKFLDAFSKKGLWTKVHKPFCHCLDYLSFRDADSLVQHGNDEHALVSLNCQGYGVICIHCHVADFTVIDDGYTLIVSIIQSQGHGSVAHGEVHTVANFASAQPGCQTR